MVKYSMVKWSSSRAIRMRAIHVARTIVVVGSIEQALCEWACSCHWMCHDAPSIQHPVLVKNLFTVLLYIYISPIADHCFILTGACSLADLVTRQLPAALGVAPSDGRNLPSACPIGLDEPKRPRVNPTAALCVQDMGFEEAAATTALEACNGHSDAP